MDFLTIGGLLVAFCSVFLANWLGGGEVILLLNLPSAIIVIVGSMGATLMQSRVKDALDAAKLLKWSLFPPSYDLQKARLLVGTLSNKARRLSLVSLDADIAALGNSFATRALQMAIDGADPDMLYERLHDEAIRIRDKRQSSISFLESVGGYAPTLGIMGSVLGLIQAMANLDSPEALGHGIAVAFVSTLYGQGFANLVVFPIAKKLSNYCDQELLYNQLLIDGVHGIAIGKHPQRLDLELSGYE
ncbi:motility protein A [Marinomonas mediterranea]|uniref:MotA/TolQ/ExbB proton channel n=1 Tax=Marinomonas mediterranea (strain ATCC 700492 / JCM 21426 / NBRC 103028 / MMB-1) TaxID=717774 RepID=F2K3I9_MARM1|nr:MotA/TolQ/ExbB proton channel family protein [Marinomonas mediterranea]ADZ92428.1 MotA/TolQ/ExbB proton channel [Marinomonas mediterranea MMB-1]WCN10380.1 chemotaxis protein MotA [Marinomonas mediterranea]WCN14426.1 chemotaxis protein MotA [Marinomonas mediterranea]WCN18478.1 chemotaxis protein MotA [Marinomonas mediterranea MMB-1]